MYSSLTTQNTFNGSLTPKSQKALLEFVESKEDVFMSLRTLSSENKNALIEFSNSNVETFSSFLCCANNLPDECKQALDGLFFRNGFVSFNLLSLIGLDTIDEILQRCISSLSVN